MGKLDGKTAIISGSARGMGEAEARLFVSEGATVLLGDVRDESGESVAADLGESATYAHLDVSKEEEWQAAVALAQERFGKLDVLVNNAGIVCPGTIEELSLEDYHRAVAVNQTGVWLGIRSAAPALRAAGGGSIVNISSVSGYVASPGLAAYGLTKWAVRGLTKTAAVELARDRIRVNSVHPGLILTDMMREAGWEDADAERGAKMVPIGRIGTADDVARLVLFLASDDSDYCTGSEFVADGGLLAGAQVGRGADVEAATR
jgi:3alpha(or 20beta)-hydroxysteroid dehydrogenase